MNAPTVREILEALAAAGDEGMLVRTMTLQFSDPEDVGRRNMRVQNVLRGLGRDGRARRSGTTEPTPYYTSNPAYRRFITPDGQRYLQNGCRTDSRVARDARRRETEAARQRRELSPAEAASCRQIPIGPERKARMKGLHAAGCTLASIGAAFGVSGERVRQIIGLKSRSTALGAGLPHPAPATRTDDRS